MGKLSLAYVSVASPPTVFPIISPSFPSHSLPPLSPAAVGKLGMWTHTSLPSLTAPLALRCNITPSKPSSSSSLPSTVPLFLSQRGRTACLIFQELTLLGFDLYGVFKADTDIFGPKLLIAKSEVFSVAPSSLVGSGKKMWNGIGAWEKKMLH